MWQIKPGDIRTRYMLGLGLVALLSVSSALEMNGLVRSRAASETVVNVAGRQRMLSQRTALTATLLAGAGTPAEQAPLRAQLINLAGQLDRAQHGLLAGDVRLGLPAPQSGEVRVPAPVAARVSRFTGLARQVAEHAPAGSFSDSARSDEPAALLALNTEALGGLLEDLDRVTNRLAQAGQVRARRLMVSGVSVLAITLLTLLAEALLIFRPLERRLRAAQQAQAHTDEDVMSAYDQTIAGWARALDLRDHETEGHSRRVTDMTVQMAQAAGQRGVALRLTSWGALLHDIGKIGVPDAVLLKQGPLDAEEWALMRQHPELAAELLSGVSFLAGALDIPRSHHERWDGSGYPQGLAGEAIPQVARWFAVVDVYDALVNDRPYRAAWSHQRALTYLQTESGSHFDPAAVALFMSLYGALDTAPRPRGLDRLPIPA